eukprot:TRINITY_DN579_c0_g5_i1.p2 TRINITY_DN579_c0_g5~~TRINITY_DN579_c0_g5_i1.p2  ORF type:complete len:627 (-),score=210.42 TRINITY_DN579_c0_g5_i1:2147-4027(-)
MQADGGASGLPQFNNITLIPTATVGTLKFSGHGIGWRAKSVGEQNKATSQITILAKDLVEATWIRTGKKAFQLSLIASSTGDGSSSSVNNNNKQQQYKFEGFQESERVNIANFLKNSFQVELKTDAYTTKGLNWGSFDLEEAGNRLVFKIGDKNAFDVPLARVAQTQLSKNELILEFNQDDVAANSESLVEMRFSIPTIKEGTKGGSEKKQSAEGEEEEEEGDSDESTQVTLMSPQLFHKQLIAKLGGKGAGVGAGGAGGAVIFLPKVKFLAPRGRYDVEMYPTFFKLHGSTYSYQIKHDHISRLLLLPKGEGDAVFVVSLDPPVRQGQTTYPHLLLHVSTINRLEGVAINVKKDQEKKYNGIKELQEIAKKEEEKEEEDNEEEEEDEATRKKSSELQVVQKAFEIFHTKKTTGPSTFKGHYSHPWIKCSFKANDGCLYPLEKSFFFIHKPPIHIPFGSIAHVEFSRVGGLHSTFDFTITVRGQSSRDGNSVSYVFNNIDKAEISNLQSFVSSKKITISSHASLDDVGQTQESTRPSSSSAGPATIANANLGDEDDESEEDEDFVAKDEEDIEEEFYSGSEGENEGDDDEDEDEEKLKGKSAQKKRSGDPINSKNPTKKAKEEDSD